MAENLIDDVAEKVVSELKKLWPFQNQREFVRSKALAAERAEFEALSQVVSVANRSDADLRRLRDETGKALADLTEERRLAILDRDARLAKAQESANADSGRRKIQAAVNDAVCDQLNRIHPGNYPREEPETAQRMYDFLTAFSKAYAKEGRQSSGDMVLEYILAADYDHAFWLWSEWIAACLAVGDRTSAEALIASATNGSTPAAHAFATRAGQFQPKLMVAKAVIALRFDGDLRLAHQIAENAKNNFGDSADATGLYRSTRHLTGEVEAGRLKIASGKKGIAQIERLVPATALLTGNWDNEGDES